MLLKKYRYNTKYLLLHYKIIGEKTFSWNLKEQCSFLPCIIIIFLVAAWLGDESHFDFLILTQWFKLWAGHFEKNTTFCGSFATVWLPETRSESNGNIPCQLSRYHQQPRHHHSLGITNSQQRLHVITLSRRGYTTNFLKNYNNKKYVAI